MWEHKATTGSTTYTSKELAELLVSKIIASDSKKDQEALIIQFLEMMSQHIADTPPRIMLDTGFKLGYLYRIFLEKNNVSYKAPDTNETNDPTTT